MDPRLLETYHTLNTIIEQDRAVTSFKYALLRGTIEICQQYSHLAEPEGDRVWYPLGLLIERWIVYYYPLFESESFVPQLNGEKNLDISSKKVLFRRELTVVTDHYRFNGGLPAFYADLRRGRIPESLDKPVRNLVRKVRYAITDGPVKHLGYSQYREHFRVFDWDRSTLNLPRKPVSSEILARSCGKFSLHRDLATLFQYFGSFIIGEGTVISKWADFTVNISRTQGHDMNRERILTLLSRESDSKRQVAEASRFYHDLLAEKEQLPYTWSERPVTSPADLHIDHLLPFSAWKNNDLWNLVPVHRAVNAKKRDAIPSPELLKKRKDRVLSCWQMLSGAYHDVFFDEMVTALMGKREENGEETMSLAFQNLVEKCRYLIEIRGYAPWNG